MKTALILAVLFCAALAAPAEDKVVDELKAVEAAAEAPEEELVAVAAPVSEEAAPAEVSFNFCPDGWFFHGGRCFLFVNSPMTWHNAEEHCNNLGANLASATNPSVYSFMQQLTQTGGQSLAWMGGFYLQSRWLWIDRQGMYFINWYNSPSSPSSYSCMYLHTSVGWSNGNCGTSYRFICSKNPFGC